MKESSGYFLEDDELALAKSKRTTENQLCFAIMLKYFQLEGHYPRTTKLIDPRLIQTLAQQLHIQSYDIEQFAWEGRSTERYRDEIRLHCGYRITTQADKDAAKAWLFDNVFSQGKKNRSYLAHAQHFFKSQRIEPPTNAVLQRDIGRWHQTFEQQIFTSIAEQLSSDFINAIDHQVLNTIDDQDDALFTLRELKKSIPGAKLKNVTSATAKLSFLESMDFPVSTLEKLSRDLLKKYHNRIMIQRPAQIKRHAETQRYAMMAMFCFYRLQQLRDEMGDVLLQLIHNMGTSAENHIKKIVIGDITKVNGKYDVLQKLASLSLNHPKATIEKVIYPEVATDKLEAIVKELSCQGPWFESQVQTKIHSLYSHANRSTLLNLLEALKFKTNLSVSKPLLSAIDCVIEQRACKEIYYPDDIKVPIAEVIPDNWLNLVVVTESNEHDNSKLPGQKIHRLYYEIAVLQAVHKQLPCRMIWIEGAHRYQDPDKDLPQDFEENREHYYGLLGLPVDPLKFIKPKQKELAESLQALNDNILDNKKVKITNKKGGRIKISPYQSQDTPPTIQRLYQAIQKKWKTINLIDILKESELQIAFTELFDTLASRQNLSKDDLQRRLLLCLYAIGTNAGMKRISAANEDISYEDLRYTKRKFIDASNVRAAIIKIVNKVFAIRDPRIWGEATTTVACDSKKISVWDQNLMVEWHSRYKGRGVMVYWHVDKNSLCVYSQLKTCSSSEVASVIKGILQHGTTMNIEGATMDTHGQSLVGFGASEFLKFDLLPRLKNINRQKLFFLFAGDRKIYPNLTKIMKSPIDWGLMSENYDETVKHMVSLKFGMIEPDMFIKRFSNNNFLHPVYKTLVEFGKVSKTNFICRYLIDEDLRIEIHESQNIVERLNSIMSFIFYGKVGEINSNDKSDQELAIVCLHLLQACMGYINTLVIQEILSEPEWKDELTDDDKRALNVLFHSHINPYGLFPLNLSERLGVPEGVELNNDDAQEE